MLDPSLFVDPTRSNQHTAYMQRQTGPPEPSLEDRPYTSSVPRPPRPSRGPRPKQGALLVSLRQRAAISQAELAREIGVPQANIAFWEWSDKPPRSDVLRKMARVFHVRVDQLLVDSDREPLATRSGPVGEVQKVFEEVRKLPRKQQRKVIEMVSALVDRYKKKAS